MFDVRCRCAEGGCGGVETSSAHDIVLPRAGVFVWHVMNDRVIAEPNRVLFFSRGEPYRVSHPIGGGDDSTIFRFAPEALADAFSRGGGGAAAPFSATSALSSPRTALLHQGVRRLLRAAARPGRSTDGIAIEEAALALLDDVSGTPRASERPRAPRIRAATERAHHDLAEATRALIAGTFREPLSLAAIARRVHSSPFHLARAFRRAVGLPIHRYRTRLRLRAALEELAGGHDDLTSLALSLGFSSHAHLTSVFRREFALAPSDFRDRMTPRRLRELSKILKA